VSMGGPSTGDNRVAASERNLPALICLLAESAESENPALAQVAREALAICQKEYAVYFAMHLRLQAAFASIRLGQPEEAIGFIGAAVEIQAAWAGATIGEADTPVIGTAGGPYRE
jgi:hypothetical protein